MDDGKLCSPSETDPLMPHKAYHRPQFLIFTVAIALCLTICTVLFVSVFPLSRCNIPLDLRDRIRKEWGIELRKHKEAVDIELRKYKEAVDKRVDIEKRWHLEDDERVHIREQWMREKEEHDRGVEERRRREEEERVRVRERWMREKEEHDHGVEKRRRLEEEERLRLNMVWGDVQSDTTCTTYATREYTARLMNVPSYYDRRVEACMATPIQIHGVEYKPKWCEDHVGLPSFVSASS